MFGRILKASSIAVKKCAFTLPANVPSRSFQISAVIGGLRSPARVQNPAPDFNGTAVVNGSFKTLKLADFSGKWLFLVFYPLDFTFVCPTELVQFSNHIEEFKKADCEVVGISTDSHFSHLAWTNTPRKEGGVGGLKYPLLSDFRKQISSDYGVLVDEAGVALRGLFLIDPKGIVRHVTVNDLPVGRSAQEAIRVLHAFQHFEKHGEVCPAGWTEKDGSSGAMIPDPEKAKDYFKKHGDN